MTGPLAGLTIDSIRASLLSKAFTAEVLAQMLNGSRFNFLILNAANDPRQLDRVILSPRGEGAVMPLPPMQNAADLEDDGSAPAAPARVQPGTVRNSPPQVSPNLPPDAKPAEDPEQ